MSHYRTHVAEFTTGQWRVKIHHPAECDPAACSYERAAQALVADPSACQPLTGRFHCGQLLGQLTVGHELPGRWDDVASVDREWTMADLRRWVAERDHIPDDYQVMAHLPPRPRGWAHAGFELYTNILHGLQVNDPEDYQ